MGRVHSHSHIAGCHQPHATGIDIALHAGNGGQWAGVNGVQHVRELACIGQVFFAAVIRHAAHPVQIGSRTKGGPFGSQHHGAYIGDLSHGFKGGGDFGNHLVAEGVADFGLRQRHGGNAGIHGQGDRAGQATPSLHYMRNTPKRVSSIGALRLAARLSASTRRVSAGSITPSSHRRALA